MAAAPPPDVLAAGVLVFRPGDQVLLVHRPRYGDWSFPKGKLDRGEHLAAAAVREVLEETGVAVRLGAPLSGQRYAINGGRTKAVSYWLGTAVGSDDVSGYAVNDEIDAVEWVTWDEARDLLTYDRDRASLREAVAMPSPTQTIVVLRHGSSRSRKAWRKDDRQRPLLAAGKVQAQRLIPVLGAYGVTRVVTSSSLRCVQSVTPYAESRSLRVRTKRRLSEERAKPRSVGRVVARLVEKGEDAVLCTHRPVLPAVFEALGVADPRLEVGEMLVVHLDHGAVTSTERHRAR